MKHWIARKPGNTFWYERKENNFRSSESSIFIYRFYGVDMACAGDIRAKNLKRLFMEYDEPFPREKKSIDFCWRSEI